MSAVRSDLLKARKDVCRLRSALMAAVGCGDKNVAAELKGSLRRAEAKVRSLEREATR